MSEIKTYTHKPTEVQALKFTGGLESADEILTWLRNNGVEGRWLPGSEAILENGEEVFPATGDQLVIETPLGESRVRINSYVTQIGPKQFVPLVQGAFKRQYEERVSVGV